MQIKLVPVGDLRPAPYNPREISPKELAKLVESIRTFGFVEPVVINADNTVIGGHQRLKAAIELGHAEVPCVTVDLPKDKERALNLALNRIGGEFDLDKLAEILNGLDEEHRRLSGFDRDEVTRALDRLLSPEDDEVPALAKASTTRLGDLFALGDHRVLCGDATDPASYERLLGGKKAAMVWTDPPYNVDYAGGMGTHGQNARDRIKNDSMDADSFRAFLGAALSAMAKNADGPFYVCMSSSELASLKAAFEEAGGHWQGFLIWVKNTFTLSRSDWQNQYEPILYGWVGKNHYFAGFRDEGNVWENLEDLKPSFKDGKTLLRLDGYHLELDGKVTGRVIVRKNATDIWREKKPARSEDHPTMKPVRLVAKAVLASSRPGDAVLDPFGGSGSTMAACEQTGRVSYSMELEPRYVDVIVRRWEKLTGRQAEKL